MGTENCCDCCGDCTAGGDFDMPETTTVAPNIYHTRGYKDDMMVEIDTGDDLWHPTMEELFKMMKLWFESEDFEFGDGYGRAMPWFYISMVAIGEEEAAYEAYQKRGWDAVTYFEECVEEHADEVMEMVQELKDAQ